MAKPWSQTAPFPKTKKQLGGFYILDCKDLDEALEDSDIWISGTRNLSAEQSEFAVRVDRLGLYDRCGVINHRHLPSLSAWRQRRDSVERAGPPGLALT